VRPKVKYNPARHVWEVTEEGAVVREEDTLADAHWFANRYAVLAELGIEEVVEC